jgi:hypothetical protein
VGLLPQLATGSLHELTKDIRSQGWAGFSTRYWLIGDHEPCVAYLARAAWDASTTPEQVYRDQITKACGPAAIDDMLAVFREVEAATIILEWNGLGLTFPVPGMMMQHWKAKELAPELDQVITHYESALASAQQAMACTRPSGKKYVDYWIGRLEFGIGYLNTAKELRSAATKAQSNKPDEAVRETESALDTLSKAMLSYVRVAGDRSDKGAIAILNEYAYRPLKAKLEELKNTKR